MPKFKSPQSVWDSFRYKVMVLGTSSQLITSDLLLALQAPTTTEPVTHTSHTHVCVRALTRPSTLFQTSDSPLVVIVVV